jgi:hypothetical protein
VIDLRWWHRLFRRAVFLKGSRELEYREMANLPP